MRYGVMMHKKYWDAKIATVTAEKKIKKVARAALEWKEEVKRLEQRVTALEPMETAHLNWKRKEPEVRHYLRSFAGMAKYIQPDNPCVEEALTENRENDVLKRQLSDLGYEVPKTVWSMKKPTEEQSHENNTGTEQRQSTTAQSKRMFAHPSSHYCCH